MHDVGGARYECPGKYKSGKNGLEMAEKKERVK
jgi:hypothetical protein